MSRQFPCSLWLDRLSLCPVEEDSEHYKLQMPTDIGMICTTALSFSTGHNLNDPVVQADL